MRHCRYDKEGFGDMDHRAPANLGHARDEQQVGCYADQEHQDDRHSSAV